jgi:hypothetical protein
MRIVFAVLGLATAAVAGSLHAQLPITAGASVSLAEHRVAAGAGLERSSGTMFGLSAATAVPWRSVDAWLSLRAGSLGANERTAVDRDVGELRIGASMPVRPWLSAVTGITVRRYASSLAAQRWVWAELGVAGRMMLLDDAIRVSAGLSMMPLVSVSGVSRPDLAVAAQSGVAYTTGRLTGTLRYALERFDFPARADGRRLEELSSLELGVTWRVR